MSSVDRAGEKLLWSYNFRYVRDRESVASVSLNQFGILDILAGLAPGKGVANSVWTVEMQRAEMDAANTF